VSSVKIAGITVENTDTIKKCIDVFKELGIKVYDKLQEALEEIIAMSGDTETFVLEQTDLDLRPLSSKYKIPTDSNEKYQQLKNTTPIYKIEEPRVSPIEHNEIFD